MINPDAHRDDAHRKFRAVLHKWLTFKISDDALRDAVLQYLSPPPTELAEVATAAAWTALDLLLTQHGIHTTGQDRRLVAAVFQEALRAAQVRGLQTFLVAGREEGRHAACEYTTPCDPQAYLRDRDQGCPACRRVWSTYPPVRVCPHPLADRCFQVCEACAQTVP